MIPVTKPFLPPIEDYQKYLQEIWGRNWLTNNGPLVNDLEIKLKDFLKIPHLLFLSNGTIALQIAIKALELKGEIITTPFSYVATTSSIVWENCTPVFADIDAASLNIDPQEIERCITDKTSAIIATHVYGNPCDVEAIQKIADKYNLKVIYDAAHCFGTEYKGASILKYGDISTISFHATKLFHTTEGGAVITNDEKLNAKMALLRNFGHDGPDVFSDVGVNGKNSELHAAMGLVNLKFANQILAKRKADHLLYDQHLEGLPLQKPLVAKDAEFNYSYYPVVFPSEEICLKVFNTLARDRIFARRYFYPALSTLDYVEKRQDTPIAIDISKRVLCLPLYYQITEAEIDMVCSLILKILK